MGLQVGDGVLGRDDAKRFDGLRTKIESLSTETRHLDFYALPSSNLDVLLKINSDLVSHFKPSK